MSEKIVVIEAKNSSTGATQIFKVHKKRAVIGSSSSSDVKIEDKAVSPVHAILEVNGIDGSPVIYDLASETGIKVKGQATVQATLTSGDLVQIGPFVLKISLQAVGEVSKTPDRVKESFGQKLFYSEKEDLKPLLLENESQVIDIFDHKPESKQSLQVVMFYGNTILDVEHFVDRKRVVIGPGNHDDFAIPPFIPGETKGKRADFELVTSSKGNYTLHLHDKMKGVVHKSGTMRSVEELSSKEVSLDDKDFAKIQIGDVSFFMNFTAAPPRLKRRKILEKDPLFFQIWLISLLLTSGILFTISKMTVSPSIEIEQLPERVATIIYEPKNLPVEKPKVETPLDVVAKATPKPEIPKVIKIKPKTDVDTQKPKDAVIAEHKEEKKSENKQQQKPDQPKTKKPSVAQHASGQEGAGAKAKGTEGSRGAPGKVKTAVPQTKAQRPGEGKKTDQPSSLAGKSQTKDMGVVDMFKSDKGTLSKLLAGGKGATNAADKLEGYSGFTSEGKGGLGAAGSGSGGGGQSMGLGGLADKGAGGGKKGVGLGALGSGGNILGGKGKISVSSGGGSGEPLVMGAIDMDAIAREINKHRDEIKYCYEKEINADRPNLSGRIGVQFVIGASGSVTSTAITSSSLKNANTESCVLGVIRRIHFPPVKGGGIAEVTYPFVFKPSGE